MYWKRAIFEALNETKGEAISLQGREKCDEVELSLETGMTLQDISDTLGYCKLLVPNANGGMDLVVDDAVLLEYIAKCNSKGYPR